MRIRERALALNLGELNDSEYLQEVGGPLASIGQYIDIEKGCQLHCSQ